MKLSVAPACASKLYSTSLPAAPARPETGTLLVSGVATGPQFSVHGGWIAAATAAAASTMPAPIGWVGGTLGAWAVAWMIDSTSSGVSAGKTASARPPCIRATTPETCGAACDVPALPQIGRASCREQVCQYM